MKSVARRSMGVGLAISMGMALCHDAMALDDVPRPPVPPTGHAYVKPLPTPPRPPTPLTTRMSCMVTVHPGAPIVFSYDQHFPDRFLAAQGHVRIMPSPLPLYRIVQLVDGRVAVIRYQEHIYPIDEVKLTGDCTGRTIEPDDHELMPWLEITRPQGRSASSRESGPSDATSSP